MDMQCENANLGWLYFKGYYDGLSKVFGNDDSVQKYFVSKNNQIINASNNQGKSLMSHNECEALSGFSEFKLSTTYPGLITGTGINHEVGKLGECKLGLQFDYTSGLPCVLGSSVKGLLRSLFPEKEGDKSEFEYIKSLCDEVLDSKKENLTAQDIINLTKVVFDGIEPIATESNSKKETVYLPMSKRDIFFDARVCGIKNDLLGLDYITPHKEVLKNPVPIQFMKIMPGVTFEFTFNLFKTKIRDGVVFTVDDKKKLFKQILLDVGIGAKTNVGYGQFEEPSKVSNSMAVTMPKVSNTRVIKGVSAELMVSGAVKKVKLLDSETKYDGQSFVLEVASSAKLGRKEKLIKVDVYLDSGKVKSVKYK